MSYQPASEEFYTKNQFAGPQAAPLRPQYDDETLALLRQANQQNIAQQAGIGQATAQGIAEPGQALGQMIGAAPGAYMKGAEFKRAGEEHAAKQKKYAQDIQLGDLQAEEGGMKNSQLQNKIGWENAVNPQTGKTNAQTANDLGLSSEESNINYKNAQTGLAGAQSEEARAGIPLKKAETAKTLAEAGNMPNKNNQQILSNTMDLRKEYANKDITKNTYGLQQSYNKIAATVTKDNPTPADDVSLVFNFMKMNDPSSSVREGEQADARNTAGISDKVRNAYNKAITGQRLTPEQRANFMETAQNLYSSQLDQQKNIDQYYAGIASQYGLNPQQVIDPSFSNVKLEKINKKTKNLKPNTKPAPGSVVSYQGTRYKVGDDGDSLLPLVGPGDK